MSCSHESFNCLLSYPWLCSDGHLDNSKWWCVFYIPLSFFVLWLDLLVVLWDTQLNANISNLIGLIDHIMQSSLLGHMQFVGKSNSVKHQIKFKKRNYFCDLLEILKSWFRWVEGTSKCHWGAFLNCLQTDLKSFARGFIILQLSCATCEPWKHLTMPV